MADDMIPAAADRTAVLAVVQIVMGRVFGVAPESIVESTRSHDVERWDSLTMVVVAIGLERRLGRVIEPGSLTRLHSVAALLDQLCRPATP
jgi:acyl carrier protein